MNRLIPFCLLLAFLVPAFTSTAQTYYPVTHLSGTQAIGGNNVTATAIGVTTNSTTCNIGPYAIGINNVSSAYMFSFSKPATGIRMSFVAFHTTESYSVYRNGVQHMITVNDLTTLPGCAGPYPLPSVAAGTVINNDTPYVDDAHTVTILFPAPVDSVRVQRHVSTMGSGCIFSFEFTNDTAAIISPIADTAYCPGDSIHVPFTTSPIFATGNSFTLQLSNATGSFASPVNIGTRTGVGAGTIHGVLPLNMPAGIGYKVRIASSNPSRVSNPNAETIDILSSPGSVSAMSNSPICEGSMLNLSANTSASNVTFNWIGPSGFSSAQQNPSISNAAPTQSGNYIVTASLGGCSVKDTLNVQISTSPRIGGYASPDDTICQGTLTTFVAMQNNGGATPQFQWYKNYAAIPGANSLLYATSNLTTGDVFYCTMYSVGVCINPVTVSTDTIEMTVLPVVTTPSAKITSVPEKPQPNLLNTFTATVYNGGPDPKFQWQLNGIDMVGATYATWNAATLRPFDKVNCMITSNDPCANIKTASSDTVVVGFATHIFDIEKQGILVHPNPTSGKFTILLPFYAPDMQATVTDMIGRIVERSVSGANERIEIDLTDKVKGNYLLIIKANDEVYRTKITLQ